MPVRSVPSAVIARQSSCSSGRSTAAALRLPSRSCRQQRSVAPATALVPGRVTSDRRVPPGVTYACPPPADGQQRPRRRDGHAQRQQRLWSCIETAWRAVAGSAFAAEKTRCYHPARPRSAASDQCRIRLEAQDAALSRRRSPVRIRYAVPIALGCWRRSPRDRRPACRAPTTPRRSGARGRLIRDRTASVPGS